MSELLEARRDLAGFVLNEMTVEQVRDDPPAAHANARILAALYLDALDQCTPPPLAPNAWNPRLLRVTEHPSEWRLLRNYDGPSQAYDAARHLRRATTRKPPGRWSFRSGQPIGENGGAWGVWAKWEPET